MTDPTAAAYHRRVLDPTVADQIARRVGGAPFANWMGFEMTGVGPGTSELSLELRPHHLNPRGRAHGGVAASLLDAAIGLALRTMLPEGATHATIQLNVTYLRPVSGGRIVARGLAVHSGNRIEYGEGTVFDAEERAIARGSATFMVVR